MEQFNRHIKVSHRVVFPLELRLFNTVCMYVVHSDSIHYINPLSLCFVALRLLCF
jgi:hypothetical protein